MLLNLSWIYLEYNGAPVFYKHKSAYLHKSGAWDAEALKDTDADLEEEDEEKQKEVKWTVTSATNNQTQT